MTIRLYFETLSPGLRARLDARYRMNKKPYHTFSPGVIRARFETGGIVPGPVEVVPLPAAQAR
jgi:hypothetical protein